MVKKSIILICSFLCFSIAIYSEGEYQRIANEEKKEHCISLGGNLSFFTTASEYGNNYFLDSGFSMSYTYKNFLYGDFSLPFTTNVVFTSPTIPKTNWGGSDPTISFGYLTRIEDMKLRFQASYTYPLGIWNFYEVQQKRIESGSGYHRIGVTGSLSKIIDPVILNTTLNYSIGLPRKERFGYSFQPGTFAISFNFVEIMNDVVGLSLSFSNSLTLPTYFEGKINFQEMRYTANISLSFLYSDAEWNGKTSFSKGLQNWNDPLITNVEGSYDIKL